MSSSFRDERGLIQDLLGPVDAVTKITSVKGAVRGNHIHHQTHQWTYVATGALLTMLGDKTAIMTAGTLFHEPPGEPHAWQALEDTTVLVFTKGPRSGEAYESDTERLAVPLINPDAPCP